MDDATQMKETVWTQSQLDTYELDSEAFMVITVFLFVLGLNILIIIQMGKINKGEQATQYTKLEFHNQYLIESG